MTQIESHEMELTPSMRTLIEKKIDKLQKIEPRITSLKAHLHRPKGKKQDRVFSLEVHIPRKEVVVEESGKNLYRAIYDGFEKVRRKIIEYNKRREGMKAGGRKKQSRLKFADESQPALNSFD